MSERHAGVLVRALFSVPVMIATPSSGDVIVVPLGTERVRLLLPRTTVIAIIINHATIVAFLGNL